MSTLIGAAVVLLWAVAVPHTVHEYMGGDYRALLHLGSEFLHPPVLADAPVEEGPGYDGQFFAALADDPFLLRPGAALLYDVPSYRATRVGLPLVAWALAAGNGRLAISVYQLLCWLLGALCVWVVARWLEDEGRSPWWAVPLVFSGGMVSSIFSSLPDAAACTLMALALWLDGRGRRGAPGVVAFSALVKDTNLVVAAAFGLAELRRRRLRSAAVHLGVPLALVAAWRAWVATRPGFGELDTNANFGLPFAWLPEKLAMPLDALEIAALATVVLSIAAVVALLPGIRGWTAASFTYAGFALVALFLTRMVYAPTWWNYARVLLPLPVLAVVLAERERVPWRRWLLRAVPISWGLIGAVMAYRWALGMAVVLLAIWAVSRRARGPAVAADVRT